MHDLDLMADGAITDLGRAAAELPLHPRLAVVVLAAQGGPVEKRAQLLAALLSDTDYPRGFFLGKIGAESDIDAVLDQLERKDLSPLTRRIPDIVSTITRACTRTSVRSEERRVGQETTTRQRQPHSSKKHARDRRRPRTL